MMGLPQNNGSGVMYRALRRGRKGAWVWYSLGLSATLALAVSAGTTPTPTPGAPTPVATPVMPAISSVDPSQTMVTPQVNEAQAETKPVSASADDNPPFTTIGIAAGAGAAALVLVVGVVLRAVRRREE